MSSTTIPNDLQKRLHVSLFSLRIGIGIVFAMWTLDKFVNPEHAAAVAEHFYGVQGLDQIAAYTLGSAQLLLVIAFIAGAFKSVSYAAIGLMHAASTVLSYGNYLDPWNGPNLLFFAAFPMMAAAFTLWLLREHDVIASVDALRGRKDNATVDEQRQLASQYA